MDRTVSLTLAGRRQEEDGSETVTRLSVPAEYFERNGCRYLLYEEAGDSPADLVKNRIKLKGNLLEVTKQGGVSARMVFEAGQRHRTGYVTPFGLLRFDVCTHSLTSLFGEDTGEIAATYSLEEEDRVIARCEISMIIQKRAKDLPPFDRYH